MSPFIAFDMPSCVEHTLVHCVSVGPAVGPCVLYVATICTAQAACLDSHSCWVRLSGFRMFDAKCDSDDLRWEYLL